MNIRGWRIPCSVRVYNKQFIRPLFEYGINISILPKGVVKKIQSTQSSILNKILSVEVSTSVAAVHLILGIEPVAVRNTVLFTKYINNLKVGEKSKLPVE